MRRDVTISKEAASAAVWALANRRSELLIAAGVVPDAHADELRAYAADYERAEKEILAAIVESEAR